MQSSRHGPDGPAAFAFFGATLAKEVRRLPPSWPPIGRREISVATK